MSKKVEWILRIGVFGTFLGHGIFAVYGNPGWTVYLNTVGIPDEWAVRLMPVIGIIDILIAITILVKPLKPVLLYAITWAFLTALIRPLSGDSIWMFVERSANWAAPLALLLLFKKKA